MTMADTNDDDKTPDGGERNPHLDQAIKDRDKLKNENRTLRERLAASAEAESKLAEYEAAKEAEAAEGEKKKNDFAAQEKRWQSQLEAERKKNQELEGWKKARVHSDRETALVDAVATKLGAENRRVVHGLVKLALADGLELPDEVNDSFVADAVKRVRDLAPETFAAKSTGNNRPDNRGTNDDDVPERFRGNPRAVKAFRAGQQRTGNTQRKE
jgi:hypothetical protein